MHIAERTMIFKNVQVHMGSDQVFVTVGGGRHVRLWGTGNDSEYWRLDFHKGGKPVQQLQHPFINLSTCSQ